MNLNVKIPEVVFVGNGADAGNSVVGRVRWAAPQEKYVGFPYGSAISLSVSLMILFGRAMIKNAVL